MDSLELTFIILARNDVPTRDVLTSEDIECLQMIGDVNLFIKEGEEEGKSRARKEGEVEVMIAGMLLCLRTRSTFSPNSQNLCTDARALHVQHSRRSCIMPLRVFCPQMQCL
jgi:hypothetical protein